MKNTWQPFIIILACLFLFTGCKKNNTSIVGTWTFTKVTSNNTYNETFYSEVSPGTESGMNAISSNAGGNVLTQMSTDSELYYDCYTYNNQYICDTNTLNYGDTVALNSYSLIINIKANGTYVMTESYVSDSLPYKTTTTGLWESTANDNITFTEEGSVLLNGGYISSTYGLASFGIGAYIFGISSLTSNQMVLNFNASYVSTGDSVIYNVVDNSSVVFSR